MLSSIIRYDYKIFLRKIWVNIIVFWILKIKICRIIGMQLIDI